MEVLLQEFFNLVSTSTVEPEDCELPNDFREGKHSAIIWELPNLSESGNVGES